VTDGTENLCSRLAKPPTPSLAPSLHQRLQNLTRRFADRLRRPGVLLSNAAAKLPQASRLDNITGAVQQTLSNTRPRWQRFKAKRFAPLIRQIVDTDLPPSDRQGSLALVGQVLQRDLPGVERLLQFRRVAVELGDVHGVNPASSRSACDCVGRFAGWRPAPSFLFNHAGGTGIVGETPGERAFTPLN